MMCVMCDMQYTYDDCFWCLKFYLLNCYEQMVWNKISNERIQRKKLTTKIQLDRCRHEMYDPCIAKAIVQLMCQFLVFLGFF